MFGDSCPQKMSVWGSRPPKTPWKDEAPQPFGGLEGQMLTSPILGLGAPYFNTFSGTSYLKEAIMK